MEVTFKVYRGEGQDGKPSYQSYPLEVRPESTVMEGLVQIREEQDGSLAFRGGCYRGFCGDCSLRVNRKGVVSCLVPIGSIEKDGELLIEPVRNVDTVKDLVYDMDRLLWDKFEKVQPWLQPREDWPEAIADEELAPVRLAMRCTMCGFCDEGCTVIDVDRDFIGPAALTKAFRFVFDPRDKAAPERLAGISEREGLWDCVHCFEASEHCPMAIDPTYRIMELRDVAIRHGIKSGKGNQKNARHYDSFASSVRRTGWLDERRLALESEGFIGYLTMLPTGLKAIQRGKAPLRHRSRLSAGAVGRIFEKQDRKAAAARKNGKEGKQK